MAITCHSVERVRILGRHKNVYFFRWLLSGFVTANANFDFFDRKYDKRKKMSLFFERVNTSSLQIERETLLLIVFFFWLLYDPPKNEPNVNALPIILYYINRGVIMR